MKNPCFAFFLSAIFLLPAPVPAGERQAARLARRDGVAVVIPPPAGEGGHFRRVDERDGVHFLGRVDGTPAKAKAVVSDGAVSYLEFAQLKTRLLGFEDNATLRLTPPDREEEVRIINETAIFLCTLSESRPERRTRDGGRKRIPAVCSVRLYLYSGIVTLAIEAEGADKNNLIRATLEWTKAVLKANTQGIDEKPISTLLDPATMRRPFALPLPEGLERFFDVTTRSDLPIFAFYRLDEAAPAVVRAATFSLLSTDPVSLDIFARMSSHQDDIFLKFPESRVVRRDNESVLYAYASDDRRWNLFTLIRIVQGFMVKFDMTYPYHDRRQARRTEGALLKWADEVRRENQPGHGGRRPAPSRQ